MLERALYFSSHGLGGADELGAKLQRGELDAVRAALRDKKGMEAAVLREALEHANKGPDAVEEVIAATVAREKPQYERFMSFLGTLGSNAPFVGLFGTVLGIIRAFHDLAGNSLQGTQAVMAGIAEALVATGVGLLVALPAVATYNIFTRRVERATSASEVLAHEILAVLKADPKERA
jgi:biopolymer transport protein ExbB